MQKVSKEKTDFGRVFNNPAFFYERIICMLRAIKDRIIIQLDENIEQSPIFLNADPIRNKGIAISVGEEVKSVKEGDYVVFHQFDELPLPQKNLIIIREKSVLGIYTE